jgi:hypothetical protein
LFGELITTLKEQGSFVTILSAEMEGIRKDYMATSWKEFLCVGLEFELGALYLQSRHYCLSHISSPFCSGYFEDGVL